MPTLGFVPLAVADGETGDSSAVIDQSKRRRPRWGEFVIETLIRVLGFSTIGFVLLIFLFLLREGLPVFFEVPLDNLFGTRWYPTFDLLRHAAADPGLGAGHADGHRDRPAAGRGDGGVRARGGARAGRARSSSR